MGHSKLDGLQMDFPKKKVTASYHARPQSQESWPWYTCMCTSNMYQVLRTHNQHPNDPLVGWMISPLNGNFQKSTCWNMLLWVDLPPINCTQWNLLIFWMQDSTQPSGWDPFPPNLMKMFDFGATFLFWWWQWSKIKQWFFLFYRGDNVTSVNTVNQEATTYPIQMSWSVIKGYSCHWSFFFALPWTKLTPKKKLDKRNVPKGTKTCRLRKYGTLPRPMYYIWHIYTYFFGFHYTYVHLSLSIYMYIFIYVYKCIFTYIYIYMFPTDPPNLRMTPPFIFIACVGIPTSFFSGVPWPRPPSCLIVWWVEAALHTWVSTILDFHVCFLCGKLTWLENHSFSIGECHRLHFFLNFSNFILFTHRILWLGGRPWSFAGRLHSPKTIII